MANKAKSKYEVALLSRAASSLVRLGAFAGEAMVTALAPSLPARRADGALTEILPPFGTNPPNGLSLPGADDLQERTIHNDPRELWYLALPSKLTPQQVLQILRSALGGDLWQQWQLLSLMLDTWPMFRKCAHEIRQAVANVRYIVKPYTRKGQEPTPSAKEKADLVEDAINSFKPDKFTDETGFAGMVYNLSDMLLNGLTMIELMWAEPARAPGGAKWHILPRAAAWVHPRHFTFGNDGKLAVFDDSYNRLTFSTARSPGKAPNQEKFLVGQFQSRSGSSLGNGLMRPLAWDWSAVVYNREWMLKFAQRYGNPFLKGKYEPGTPDHEVAKLNQFMKSAGSQGWINTPNTLEIEIEPAQSLGADNAQVALMRQADEHCQILLLGQTSTTTATPGKLGSEDVHDSVKRENVQGLANAVATVLTEQFATAILRVNYGDDSECPTISADFTEEADPKAEAERDDVFLSAKVPLDAEEFYQRHNLKQPEQGDTVIVGGQLGKLGAIEEISQKPEPPAFGPDGEPVPPGKDGAPGFPGKDKSKPGKGQGAVDEVNAADVRAALAEATSEELEEIQALLVKAAEAPHRNGEAKAVVIKVKQIKDRSRL